MCYYGGAGVRDGGKTADLLQRNISISSAAAYTLKLPMVYPSFIYHFSHYSIHIG